jgi:hypothetical protein
MKRTENDAKRYQTFEDLEVYHVHKLINGYLRFLRSRTTGDSSRVREAFPDYDLDQDDFEDLYLGRFNPSSL